MFTSKFSLLTLAGLATATPFYTDYREILNDNRVVLGYRTAFKVEGQDINFLQTIFRASAFDLMTYNPGEAVPRMTHNLGKGVYMSPNPGEWPAALPELESLYWHCIVTANKEAFKKANKARVPISTPGRQIWYNEDIVDEYVGELSPGWTVDNTLRMSYAPDYAGHKQLMVPSSIVNDESHDLDIKATCSATVEELKRNFNNPPPADYDGWTDNIKGQWL